MKVGFPRTLLVIFFLFITFFFMPPTDLQLSLGQDGIPTRAEASYTFNAKEDEPFNAFLQDVNISGEDLIWTFVDKPGWVEMNSGLLFGTPGNDDVGYTNFTVNVTSTTEQVLVDVSISVANTPPLLVEGSVAPMGWEDQDYVSKFDLREDGDKWEVRMKQSGPWNTTWLEIDRTGRISGTPRNVHVGNWTVNLTLDDLNGGIVYYEWTITVVNELPNITVKDYGLVQEWVEKTIDFDCRSEGDGATYYQVIRDDFGGTLDPVTGKFTFLPGLSARTRGVLEVESLDIFGGKDLSRLEITINNTPPRLLSELPKVFKAGEEVLIDLDSNDEIGFVNYQLFQGAILFSDGSGTDEFISNGKLRILPWNMDVGQYSYWISLTDAYYSVRMYPWNFTVIENSSFNDPEVSIEVLSVSNDLVRVNLHVDPSGQKFYKGSSGNDESINYSGVFVTYPGSHQGLALKEFDPENVTIVEVPISNISGLVNLTVIVRFEHLDGSSRVISNSVQIEIPPIDRDGDGNAGSFPWWLIIILFLILSLTLIAMALTMVEKTSYAAQMAIFRGGTIDEEPVLSLVHERPGIHFKELLEYSNFSRRDLVSTLVHLERTGTVRPIPDGTLVRFYPTVGSFVDGPLVLNKQQERIAVSLLDVVKLSHQELSDATGISKKKLERETSLISLKGILRKRNGREGPEYYMSAKEKKRLREWLDRRSR
ncbi:MAG: putative Ig domain-containing protein [Thermoplasmatota archaeon]